jgi:hypothetical protein
MYAAAGETLSVAVEMAARNALNRLWTIGHDDDTPWRFDTDIDVQKYANTPNHSLVHVLTKYGDGVQLELLPQPIRSMSRDKELGRTTPITGADGHSCALYSVSHYRQ